MGSFLMNATGTGNSFQAEPIVKQDLIPGIKASAGQFNNAYNNQGALAQQLQAQAMGVGPNPAQLMLQQSTNRNIAQNAGFLSSQKGLSPALAARLAAQNQANIGQQAAGQGALMGAQQQLSARDQLAGVYNQQAQGALGMYGQQQNALANQNSAVNGQSQINSGVAAGNQKQASGMVGGLIGGLGSAFGFAEGGTVPDAPATHGFMNGYFGPQAGASAAPQPFFKKPIYDVPGAIKSWMTPEGPSTVGEASPWEMGGGLAGQPAPIPGVMAAAEGGKVPGKAPVPGDSYANDVVDAKLSPGEIVIPRHITMHEKAPELAAKFVELELAKQASGSKKNFAEGGQVPASLSLEAPPPQDMFAVPTTVIPSATPSVEPQSPGIMSIADQVRQQKQGMNEAYPGEFQKLAEDTQRAYDIGQYRKQHGLMFQNIPEDALAKLSNSPGKDPNKEIGAPVDDGGPAFMPDRAAASPAGGMGGSGGSIDDYLRPREALAKEQSELSRDANYDYGQKQWNLDVERENMMNAYREGKIDPDRYFNNLGTGGKIRTALGVILGGLGSGMTGGPNHALDMLNKHIDNDIKAQEADMGKNRNLLAMNMEQTKDLRSAREATRIMQRDLMADKLQELELNAKDPMVRARAMAMKNQLALQNAQSAAQLKMWQSMSGGGMGGQGGQGGIDQQLQMLRMVNPEMAKSIEARYVPGVGVAPVPVPQEVRAEIIGKKTFDQMARRYYDFASKNANSLSPAVIKQGATLAAELQGAYRQAVKGGVYKEGEQEFIEKLIPSNPAQFAASIRTLPKVKELIHSNEQQLNTLKSGYGLQSEGGGVEQLRKQYRPKTFKAAK